MDTVNYHEETVGRFRRSIYFRYGLMKEGGRRSVLKTDEIDEPEVEYNKPTTTASSSTATATATTTTTTLEPTSEETTVEAIPHSAFTKAAIYTDYPECSEIGR